ncbi:MAG TPA: CRISPR-associated endonuclease Cas2 [Candidatus Bacteroides merdigallinarum]|uniref:CRISPR-associated endoribonuclease Cas2 n=1 Tax=Candidatus Bacteroides merdigallinarum TaxID=2838473 RepID=A0A9D2J1M5_9BACE|nr:CRISPR-associated endonuclease Cas2 [Candidatus Bacteroides merdigallinarum]
MLVISYDIADDLKRSRFARMLTKHGAIRLQYSVYEIVNTKRVTDNIQEKIKSFAKHFNPSDSVIIFEISRDKLIKFGNAIHRDENIVFL